jgi:glucose/mannose transport system permease protein
MAILLAGLRNIDSDIWKATRVDGIPTWRVYLHIVVPMLLPVITTCVVLQALGALRAYDIVVAMTGGGPGFSSDLPGKFVIDYAGERANLGLAAAAAVEMLLTLVLLLVPSWIVKFRQNRAGTA